ncbi:MAG: DinB superfamily protein [Ekhidna sp.]|uniref:DinB superfamily protein n=1 Tax=Ekhidna sp. TaxID=2608089 RepID=UPI0032EEF670
MMIKELEKLFVRDLEKLRGELDQYPNEETLWKVVDGISNSGGNLVMHLCGNLQHFIGAVLHDTGYVRQRDFEFNGRMDLNQLNEEIGKTIEVIRSYFKDADSETFDGDYPLEVFGYPMSIGYFLIHLQGHLNYHLGQINYHRRILS